MGDKTVEISVGSFLAAVYTRVNELTMYFFSCILAVFRFFLFVFVFLCCAVCYICVFIFCFFYFIRLKACFFRLAIPSPSLPPTHSARCTSGIENGKKKKSGIAYMRILLFTYGEIALFSPVSPP